MQPKCFVEDPHNRSGQHQIKKLAGPTPGEGQWRTRWRDYRLRYDIFDNEVALHSLRHRKEAYWLQSRAAHRNLR